MRCRLAIALAAALLVFAGSAPASAEVTLTPYVGSLFSGDLPDNKADYGALVTFMGGGIFGAEVAWNYSPRFIGATATNDTVRQSSLMGNLIVGIPIGGGDAGQSFRPYLTGGVGLFRMTAKESDFFDRINSNDFAVNFGGGVMGFFNDHIGLRGDLRYFRTLRDEDAGSGVDFDFGDLNFWRWSLGPTFRW